MLYKALILSKIDYGCQAYATASKTLLTKLDTIQATALRIATGAYKGTSNTSLTSKLTSRMYYNTIKPMSRQIHTKILGTINTTRGQTTNQ